MKIFVVLLLVTFFAAARAALTLQQQAKLLLHFNECTKSTGVSTEVLAQARNGNFADDPKLKEYYHCMFRRIGIQNEAGDILIDVVKAKLPAGANKENIEKLIAICKDRKGATPADTAFLVYKCHWELSPQRVKLDF